MIAFSDGSPHDIDHFLKVWALAKAIGEPEGVDSRTREILEFTAVVHMEADFLVNAGESGYTRSMIEVFLRRAFRTSAGIRLLDSMYPDSINHP